VRLPPKDTTPTTSTPTQASGAHHWHTSPHTLLPTCIMPTRKPKPGSRKSPPRAGNPAAACKLSTLWTPPF
jgi:hypothetical protein